MCKPRRAQIQGQRGDWSCDEFYGDLCKPSDFDLALAQCEVKEGTKAKSESFGAERERYYVQSYS